MSRPGERLAASWWHCLHPTRLLVHVAHSLQRFVGDGESTVRATALQLLASPQRTLSADCSPARAHHRGTRSALEGGERQAEGTGTMPPQSGPETLTRTARDTAEATTSDRESAGTKTTQRMKPSSP